LFTLLDETAKFITSGSGGVFEEQVHHRAATQRRYLRHRPPIDLGHMVGEIEQTGDGGGVELVDAEQVLHSITTPSSLTVTFSAREVGRFLPT
jgi:hypothetical protein